MPSPQPGPPQPVAGPAPRVAGGAATWTLAGAVLLSVYVLFVPQPPGAPVFPYADKVVHLALFALLAAAVRWRCGPAALGVGAVALYAAGSEVVQAVWLPSRSGDVRDLFADLLGVALGWALASAALGRAAGAGDAPAR